MPLACVNVNGKQATVLFDSGSDKSYISQEFVYRLKPKYVKQTSVSFATFGGRSHGSRTKMYQFSMKGLCGSDGVTVQLPEVPVICLPLGKPKVDSALLEEFDHLDLAFDYKDSSPHVTIDILIGQDLYWSFILGDFFQERELKFSCSKVCLWVDIVWMYSWFKLGWNFSSQCWYYFRTGCQVILGSRVFGDSGQ